MTPRVTALLAILLAGRPCVAAAADSQDYAQCQAQAGGVTTRLEACDVAELARRDAALNEAYGHLVSALPADRQERLRAAERAWLAFVAAECDFRMSAETGGTDAPLVHDGCRLSLMADRIADLRQAIGVSHF